MGRTKTARETIPERLRLVREAAQAKQREFVDRLNEAAERLYGPHDGPRYLQATVSRLETGMQAATLDDVAVYAAADPERRGKLWLAWDERVDSAVVPSLEQLAALTGAKTAPRRRAAEHELAEAKRPAAKRANDRGKR